VFKPSRRALGIASAFTLSAVILAPSASAALLGSGGQSSQSLPVVSGLGSSLPFSGDLTAPLGDLLGNSEGVGNLLGLGNFLQPGMLGGLTGGLPVVSGLLGNGGLPVVGNLLGNGGLPVVGDLLGDGGLPLVGGLAGVDGADSSGGEMLSPITDTTLACDAAIPEVLRALVLGDLADTICEPFDGGLLGVLSSL
jgi:hypothetical protein